MTVPIGYWCGEYQPAIEEMTEPSKTECWRCKQTLTHEDTIMKYNMPGDRALVLCTLCTSTLIRKGIYSEECGEYQTAK